MKGTEMSDKKYLYELMSAADYMNVCNAILATRKEDEEGAINYEEIEYSVGDTTYKVLGHHFPVRDVIESASSNCKVCNSKGYQTVNVPKSKLPDPSGYLVEIEEESTPGIITKSPDFWRITTPCECAVKNVIKKNGGLFTIDTRCVYVDVTYTSETKKSDKDTSKSKIEIAR